MSKNILVILVILVVALVGGYLFKNNNSKMMDQPESMVKDEEVMMEGDVPSVDESMMDKPEDDAMMAKTDRFVPYTPSVLADASTPRRVLYFYANWCSTCIPANADFEKNAALIPEDVTVIRVNYNDTDTDEDEKALAAKYGITYQHTFVQIDSSGQVVTTWNGGKTAELLKNIK